MSIPTSLAGRYAAEFGYQQLGGYLAGIGSIASGIMALRGGQATHAQNIQAAHDLAAGVLAFTPLAPFAPLVELEGIIVGTVGQVFEKELARQRARRLKHRAQAEMHYQAVQRGQHPYWAARAAAARVGILPELVAPLAPPIVTTVPAVTFTQRITRGVKSGKTKTFTRPAYDIVQPNPAAVSPWYNPLTGATDTERGIAITFAGPESAPAQEYLEELQQEYGRRIAPGFGMVPPVFARYRR